MQIGNIVQYYITYTDLVFKEIQFSMYSLHKTASY